MIVYHGSDTVIIRPDTLHSKSRLDFGKGFYVTTVEAQAERWAKRKSAFRGKSVGIVNRYELLLSEKYKVLDFGEDLAHWIDFVCDCRNGSEVYRDYDIIKGRVADDKVFRVVDMYKRGIWERERAIREIRAYDTYDQICFVSQDAIDTLLTFEGSFEVAL